MEDKQKKKKKKTTNPHHLPRSTGGACKETHLPFLRSPGIHMWFKGQSSGVSFCLEMLSWDMISQGIADTKAWVVERKMPEEKYGFVGVRGLSPSIWME